MLSIDREHITNIDEKTLKNSSLLCELLLYYCCSAGFFA
uniref:Uncharacterized protein n=1 Tax=Yersinia enterocolitica W22703 TaxID=913028 RepID=F4N6U8_YEREN|nr:unknown protein [Yersinia enterocolitica W22703]